MGLLGIYGSWGMGKTSTLELMIKELHHYKHTGKPNKQAIIVRFNPWYFEDDAELIRSFFNTLASAVEQASGETPTSLKREIGEKVREYGRKASPLIKNLDPLLTIVGAAVPFVSLLKSIDIEGLTKTVGDALAPSQEGLMHLRDEVNTALATSKRPIVVLIDDIDRLESDEIQALLKLVKLSADFKNTTYVLAFDDEIVAAALEKRYSKDRGGRGFLEKIIQVPLHLPVADTETLKDITINGLNEAILSVQVELQESEVDRFHISFDRGFMVMLVTPRVAKRYANALVFALPLLHEQVNVVDLMLIEGIRVFYPRLYEAIRDNPSVFLQRALGLSDWESAIGSEVNTAQRKRDSEVISAAFTGLSTLQRHAAESLLEELFPLVKRLLKDGVSEDTKYTADEWDKNRRITSATHFSRYFLYSAPRSDIEDISIEVFVSRLPMHTLKESVDILNQLAAKRSPYHGVSGINHMITKLELMSDRLSIGAAEQLVLALASCSKFLGANARGGALYLPPTSRAAHLVGRLLETISDEVRRDSLAIDILKLAESIDYKFHLFSRLVTKQRRGTRDESLLSASIEHQLREQLVDFIRNAAQQGPLYSTLPPMEALRAYQIWAALAPPAKDTVSEAGHHLIQYWTDEPLEFGRTLTAMFPIVEQSDLERVYTSKVERDRLYGPLIEVVGVGYIGGFLGMVYPSHLPEVIMRSSPEEKKAIYQLAKFFDAKSVLLKWPNPSSSERHDD